MEVTLVSVNVGRPAVVGAYRGKPVTSAIGKRPVEASSLYLDRLNLEGDQQADLVNHGGPHKAVYAYPLEHIHNWAQELTQELGPASFGENLTVSGLLETDVCIGDVWAWGEALLQVSQPRRPCYKLATFRGRKDLPKKLVARGRTGWYMRVLRPGRVPTGGPIEIARRDPAGVTVLAVHRALVQGQGTPEEWQAMAGLDALSPSWREDFARRLAAAA